MKNKKLALIIGAVSLVAAVTAALTAFFIVKDKQKRDDEELMEYLDSSIEYSSQGCSAWNSFLFCKK